MKLSELIKSRRIREIPIDKEQINKALELCKRDIKASEVNLEKKLLDWSFNISYNSILQASRALMYSYGYAPHSEDSHKVALEFVDAVFGEKYAELVNKLNRFRKKRHRAVYEDVGIISKTEAEYTLKEAKRFIKIVEERIKKKLK